MAECKKCKGEIKWGKNQNDKWIPLNPDGSTHWEACKTVRRKGMTWKPGKGKITKPQVGPGKTGWFYNDYPEFDEHGQYIPPWAERLDSLADFLMRSSK